MRTESPFTNLTFDEGCKLANKMGIERYDSPELTAKLKQKAVNKLAEALEWFLGPCLYDAATLRIMAKERLKEYRKYQ